MTDEELDTQIQQLKEVYGVVAKATTPTRQILVKLESVPLPAGCRPARTASLLVLQSDARPLFYVKPGIRLPNRAEPRSTNVTPVDGEAWLQFSYSFPWEWGKNTLAQFVGTSLQRFRKTE